MLILDMKCRWFLFWMVFCTLWTDTLGKRCEDQCDEGRGNHCYDVRDAKRELQSGKKFGRRLSIEEIRRLVELDRKLKKKGLDKVCVCKLPNVWGEACDKECDPGFHDWLCLSECTPSSCPQNTSCPLGQTLVLGQCQLILDNESQQTKDGPEDGKVIQGACREFCKVPLGICIPAGNLQGRLEAHYSRLLPQEERRLEQNLVKFDDGKPGSNLKTCYCKRSGFYGEKCDTRCKGNTGGYHCITNGIQCEDYCLSDHGTCATLSEIKKRVLLTNDIKRLDIKQHTVINEDLQFYQHRTKAEEYACLCNQEGKTGRNCEQACPPGYKGHMCIIRDFANAELEAAFYDNTVDMYEAEGAEAFQAQILHDLVYVSQEKIDENLKILKANLTKSMLIAHGLGKWKHGSVEASVLDLTVIDPDVDDSRFRRQARSAGIQVLYGVSIPASDARRNPNIRAELVRMVKRSGDNFQSDRYPGLKMDKGSVRLTKLTVPKLTRESSGQDQKSSSFFEYRSFLAGVGVLFLCSVVVGLAIHTRQRRVKLSRAVKRQQLLRQRAMAGARQYAWPSRDAAASYYWAVMQQRRKKKQLSSRRTHGEHGGQVPHPGARHTGQPEMSDWKWGKEGAQLEDSSSRVEGVDGRSSAEETTSETDHATSTDETYT